MISKLFEIINESNISKDNNINSLNVFKLPISYIHDKYPIQENIKTDLGLSGDGTQTLDNVDGSLNSSPTEDINGGVGVSPTLYDYVFNPAGIYASKIIPMWSEYYTTNISFLNDSKNLIKNFKHIGPPGINMININNNITKVSDILNEVRNETGFYEKYKYIDIKFFEEINNNPHFLQYLTVYNLASPILSLAVPIIMLIIPFFLLKLQGIPITISAYINNLLIILKKHPIGNFISNFSNVGWDRRVFLFASVIFYFINIYQNIISCYTFYKNIYKIREYLLSISSFLTYSVNSITNINKYCGSSYIDFIAKNETIKTTLNIFNKDILSISLDKISIKQIGKIGNILKLFYQLFKNKIYQEAIYYSFYLHGYIENIVNLQKNILIGDINYCKFTRRNCRFKGAYFAPIVDKNPIKNTYKLTKNIIITGPNAAGKTTLLKTTLFNIILSQQLGVGFYKKALINPYRYIHSYINIPDTSDRDSLFQAEARRCKDILDVLLSSNDLERHFCIFDEIYSGTNPTEAVASAYSFLKYISKFTNMDFILTTHYISLCNLLNNSKNISNQQMKVEDNIYTYKLINGISNIKGGVKVLDDLLYPEEIINSARDIIIGGDTLTPS
jgi:hypothetical protein